MNIEKLPMYNIKHYQRKYLIDKGLKDTLFDENNLSDIEKLLANLRRSYIDSELFNDEFYIYDGKDNLNKQQILFLQKMATDLNLNYAMKKNYLGEQFHCLYNRPMTIKVKTDDKALIEIYKEDYTNIANIIRQYINPADIKDQTVYNSLQNFLNLDVDSLFN